MHPIERLRYVARASGADQRVMVRETASALHGLGLDPSGLVTACRRIVEHNPTSGPVWWLCARMLTAAEPMREASLLARQIDEDPSEEMLIDHLPADGLICVIGWPDLVTDALVRRGDVRVLAIDGSESDGFVRRLQRADVDVEQVPAGGLGAAAAAADLVVIEASAVGSDGVIAPAGSRAAAAVAYCSEIPVWLVAGRGRRLPMAMWTTMLERLSAADLPWELDEEIVPLATFSHVIGPNGLFEAPGDAIEPECPVAPELLRNSVF